MHQRLKRFFVERWHCRVPARQVVLRDILLAGTLLNLLSAAMVLTLLNHRVATVWVLAAYALALPYNLFLVRAAWHAADANPALRLAALVWMAAMFVV